MSHHVYTEVYGSIAPRVTGSISTISSLLIIVVIFRSSVKLSSIYHRIMFGMSIGDILASIAMALTSVPMPSDNWTVQYTLGFSDLPTYGNTATCTAQGFFWTFGTILTYGYNMSLCAYYVFAIAFMMKDEIIERKLEPRLLHGSPIIVALLFSTPPLFVGMYNPSGGSSWCTISKFKSTSGRRVLC